MNKIIAFVKEWTLPVSITLGSVLYLIFAYAPALSGVAAVCGPVIETIFPLTVFLTLFVTFSKVDFHKMRFTRWHLALLVTQFLLVALICAIILISGIDGHAKLALEVFLICIIAPCASAAPVVTAKLGGNLNTMTTFTLISSVVAAFCIPAVFPLIESEADITFFEAFLVICEKLAAVLLLPLLLGWVVRHYVHPLYKFIVAHPNLGFYCWGVALTITSGITVRNIVHASCDTWFLSIIAILSLAVCIFQFILGRKIGHKFGDVICSGQGMFQKNTVLAIWVAYMYLTPEASIGAGCYVLWQNFINSYEIWEHDHKHKVIA